jgi:hypothetical protein
MVNTEKEKIMSQLMTKLLERLAEMFPSQDYQSRLEQYIVSRHPQNAADVEMFTREYSQRQGGWI